MHKLNKRRIQTNMFGCELLSNVRILQEKASNSFTRQVTEGGNIFR